MPSIIRLGLAVGLALLAKDIRPVAAQAGAVPAERWQLTLDDDSYLWNVRLVELAGDTLLVRQSDSLVRAPVARISEMRRFRETVLRIGDVHTSALDAMGGDIHDVYRLAGLPVPERRRAIRQILTHPARHD